MEEQIFYSEKYGNIHISKTKNLENNTFGISIKYCVENLNLDFKMDYESESSRDQAFKTTVKASSKDILKLERFIDAYSSLS